MKKKIMKIHTCRILSKFCQPYTKVILALWLRLYNNIYYNHLRRYDISRKVCVVKYSQMRRQDEPNLLETKTLCAIKIG